MSLAAGQRILASDLAQLEALTAPGWTVFTPTWTGNSGNPSVGNGTVTARSRRPAGADLATVEYRILAGGTTTFGSGFWALALPAIGMSGTSQTHCVFVGEALDASTGLAHPIVGRYFSGSIVFNATSGTSVSSTVPFTWASGDSLLLSGQFEPA